MEKKEIEVFYPTSKDDWRKWLEKNHLSTDAVWVVFYKKSSEKKSITWSESVDVALCFGWIDSKHIKIDEEKSRQYFSKRKPKSTWSKVNKNKVEVLISSGLMMGAGLRSIEIAKENGSWTILDEVEELVVPADLESAFAEAPTAHQFYLTLSKSWKKAILYWIVSAKQPETRTRRIAEIIDRGNENLKPKQFQ